MSQPITVPVVVYDYIQHCLEETPSIIEALDVSNMPLDVIKWARSDIDHEILLIRALLKDILVTPDKQTPQRYLIDMGAHTNGTVRCVNTLMKHQGHILRVTKLKSRLLDHANNSPFLFTLDEILAFDPTIIDTANLVCVGQDRKLMEPLDKHTYF